MLHNERTISTGSLDANRSFFSMDTESTYERPPAFTLYVEAFELLDKLPMRKNTFGFGCSAVVCIPTVCLGVLILSLGMDTLAFGKPLMDLNALGSRGGISPIRDRSVRMHMRWMRNNQSTRL
jgi:hypothetical protein